MPDPAGLNQPVDVLSYILDAIRIQAAAVEVRNGPTEFGGEGLPKGQVLIFAVREGRCVGSVSGERVDLNAGDVLAILRTSGHWELLARRAVCSVRVEAATCDEWTPPLEDFPSEVKVLCCSCNFADAGSDHLLGALPPILHVRQHEWTDPGWLAETNAWIDMESGIRRPGADAVIRRLVELLWLQLARHHVATARFDEPGWAKACFDSHIGGALRSIHAEPAACFTVESLAHAVGMSRSAFATLFTQLVGEPPLRYVARWRMLKAAEMLKDDVKSLAEVAAGVGYESEAAFSKAFKRWSGKAPGEYRRGRRWQPRRTPQLPRG